MENTTVVMIFVVVLLVLVVWGLIGSSKAAEIGTSCDIGIGKDGSALCWKWHQNAVGNIGNAIDQIFNK